MQELGEADPRRVGPYELVGVLGSGGMGTVYLGRATDGGLAAVKVIHADLARSPEFRARFRREVAATRAVTGPRLAAVLDAGGEDAQPWLATEYVRGPSLQAVVAQHGPLPAEKVRLLGAGLAEALTTIHAAGLVHRDVKPPNVLLPEDGPRLIDFGIARSAADSTVTRTGVMLGTPQFMAPELLRGRDTVTGPAADVFAMAGVLCYAATGAHPFGDGLPEQILYRIAHEEPDLAEVDPALRRVLRTCLAKEPTDRPTAAELAAILSQDLRTLALTAGPDLTPTEALPVIAAEEAERGRKRRWKLSVNWELSLRRVWTIAIGAGVTATAVLLVLVMPGGPAHGSNQPQAGGTPNPAVTTPAGSSSSPAPTQPSASAAASAPASQPVPAPASQPAGGQVPGSAPTGPATRPAVPPTTGNPAPQPPAQNPPGGNQPPPTATTPPPPPTTAPANHPPQPATGLAVTPQAPAYIQMQISWSAQSGATSYDILYTESLMGSHEIDGVSNTSTTISAVPQETVCAQVRSVNPSGKSAWSPSSPVCSVNWTS